jgi:hypothetical protein
MLLFQTQQSTKREKMKQQGSNPVHVSPVDRESLLQLSRNSLWHSEEFSCAQSCKEKALDVPKRQVHFHDQVKVRITLNRSDFTKKEISDVWYNRDDMINIRNGMNRDILLISEGKESEYSTSRGLEFRFPAGRVKRTANKIQSISAVLDEQDRQLLQGIINLESIRDVYLSFSRRCHMEAHEVAKLDEREVNHVHQDETQQSRIRSLQQSISQRLKSVGGKTECLRTRILTTKRLLHRELLRRRKRLCKKVDKQ